MTLGVGSIDEVRRPHMSCYLQEIVFRPGEVLLNGPKAFSTRRNTTRYVVDTSLVVDLTKTVGVLDLVSVSMELGGATVRMDDEYRQSR